MIDSYASLGCNSEIWNNARTVAYADAGVRPASGSVNDCGCADLGRILGEAYTVPQGQRDPEDESRFLGEAPWFDNERPESKDFAGLLVTSVEGLEDSPFFRNTTQGLRGAVLGREQVRGRTIRVTGWLVARTCCAGDYGIRWLTQALRGCSGDCGTGCSGGDTMNMLRCCPEPGATPCGPLGEIGTPHVPVDDDLFRCLHDVAVIDGPRVLAKVGTGCGSCGSGCPWTQVEFTLFAANPFFWTDRKFAVEGDFPQGEDEACDDFCSGEDGLLVYSEGFEDDDGDWFLVGGAAHNGTAIEFPDTGTPEAFSPGINTIVGHSYVVFVTLTGDADDDDGSFMEFAAINSGGNPSDQLARHEYRATGDPGDQSPLVQSLTFIAENETTFLYAAVFGPTGRKVYTLDDVTVTDIDAPCDQEDDCTTDDPCDTFDPNCIVDPRCDVVAPPAYPLFTSSCFCDAVNRTPATCVRLNHRDLPTEWFDAAPVVEIYGGDNGLFDVQIRFFPNPLDRPCADVTGDQCNACVEINVSHVPAGGKVTIDGVSRRTIADCGPGAQNSASNIVFGHEGKPFDYPLLSCGYGYCVCLSANATANGGPADNARFEIYVAGREP